MTHLACVGGAALRCLALASVALGALFAAAPPAGAAIADFSWSPDPPIVRQQATFTAVEDPAITAYRWDLDGNGTYDDPADASGPQVPRTFQNVRVYEIGLVTVDVDGNLTQTRKQVTVVAPNPEPNQPPDASFVFFPAGPVTGEPITFVSTSTDPDSPVPVSAMSWDLNGDDVFDDAEGPSATTSYPVPGTYTISLRITTNATDVATLVLNVGSPGAPGTSVGQRGLSLLSPFPIVRIAGRISRRGARIRRLTINAPPGTGVKVRCNGRGCPFKRVLRTVSSRVIAGRGLPPTRLLRIRRLKGRLLRPGVTLRLFVTRPDAVGKYTRFRIRRGKPPLRSDMCVVPGSGRPLTCPSRGSTESSR
ncbi:MAG: PKD domain-containing protein [Solirubrobacterales bacterium]